MTGSATPASRARRSVTRAASAALTLACAAPGLAACSGGAAPAAVSEAPPPGLSATLQQARIDEAKHVLSVAVRNDGPPVWIERLQLVAPPLEVLPPATVATEVGTTPRVDLRLTYGSARCTGATIPEPGPAHALAWIREGTGTRRIRLPLPHPDPLLTSLVRLDCAAAVVGRSADIRFGTRWTRERHGDRETLTGTVVVRRKAPGVITLQDLRGSVIFQLTAPRAEGTPIAVLEPGRDSLEVPVRFVATGCDPHALAESKKTYVFPYWAGAGTLKPQFLTFGVSPELRTALDRLIADGCDTGSG
ncbi:hypothetical protein Misp01_73720 [Microtetraspora sp. NBRC 13810]|uniref:hypothetical protein n=1 Tax=Microtetraspora sp. NBRC 13810 TaxID=3030990 RepID=UPI0024A5CB3F|nr:hypothetical protein [Microtetraspora sp. NBRC 13810]GLW12244.1 hypothetical protein Misp01_73720 [Microtetraspora sp. NBRC 13810]